jgi:penicillin-binding protein 1A
MEENPFSRKGIYDPKGAILTRFTPPRFTSILSTGQRLLRRFLRYAEATIGRYWRWILSASSRGDLLKKLFQSVLIAGGFLGGVIVLWLLAIYLTLPNVNEVGALFAAESTVVTDRNGIELYRIHGDEDRTLVPLSEISDFVEQATIAIEDERFYERGCFDPRAFSRAVLRNILGGFGSQGGSTITQQFAKNALIGSRKKRITRKLKEFMLSCTLEGRYSKNEILELYLNRIPYGHNAHGAEQASRIYFAKSASGLTLAEASVLAALPQLPSYLSPYGSHVRTTLSEKGKERMRAGKIRDVDDIRDDDFWLGLVGECFALKGYSPQGTGNAYNEESQLSATEDMAASNPVAQCSGMYLGGRTDQVLKNMQNQGFISEEDRHKALAELQTITFKRARENIRAPHFVMWIREFIEEQFGGQLDKGFLERGGLTITTTLDYALQQKAEDIINEIGQMNIDLYNAHNAALLVVDPHTGHIVTYVGNRDYWDEATDGNVDIIRAPRQPGSSFKPFSYAATFLNGYNPATVLYDVPTLIGEDQPENFDSRFWGPLTIRKALGASRNVPAAKSYFLAGGEKAIVGLAASMGIPTLQTRQEELSAARGTRYEYGWPLSLGAAEVPLYEMVQGYTTFARGGTAIDLVAVLRIEDHRGNILYQADEKPRERDVLDPRAAYMITSILSDESVRPTEYWRTQLSIPGFQTAAKTGTSNKCLQRDEKSGVCIESKPDNTWTIGYTTDLVAGAWAGNASGGALAIKASGLDTASHIWRRFMIAAHRGANTTQTTFSPPEGLASAQVSELSGKLASPCTPLTFRRAEIFFKGEEPKTFDDACAMIEVDKLTGLLASDECPAEARESKSSHLIPHSILSDRWPLWEQAVQDWAKQLSAGTGSIFWKESGVRDKESRKIVGAYRAFRGTGAFLPLPLPLAPTEKCTLALTPGRLEKPTLSIVLPSQGGSATAPTFKPEIRYTVGHSVREIRYELDGRTVAVVGSGSSLAPTIRLPRRFTTSGIHILTVTLIDSYFNQVSDSVHFNFREDSGTPQVSILSPFDGAVLTVGSTVTVRVDARDPGGAIDRVQFFLRDKLITTRREAPYEAVFTVEGEPGSTTLRVVAQDVAKNQGEDAIEVEIITP